ncbi:MAG: nucleotidyltransferase family protein [Planctomycetes bacterium]|nr:nucleotidyltransferase family protein [Planctomycetota bacterium]
MKALILGAGYGVRLYPLTQNMPKPLLAIAGKPVINWTIERLNKIKEIKELFIVVNQRFYPNYERWVKEFKGPKKITVVNDGTTSPDDRLGAIKDIRFVIEQEKINDDLLIVAGDNLFDFALKPLVDFYKKKGPCIALINLKKLDEKLLSQYGIATLNKAKQIVEFEEKPPVPKSTLAAVCLYIFSRDRLGLINDYLDCCYNPDAPGYYIQWLYKQTALFGCEMKGKWFDIGDIDSYNKANEYFAKKVKRHHTSLTLA